VGELPQFVRRLGDGFRLLHLFTSKF
jgi:hypothetical protein